MNTKIPFDDGKAVLDTLVEKPLIGKRRYKIPAAISRGKLMSS
jgi:hypothetical protein